MKSKTSFFNGTALKKDLTRFAPAWLLYFVFLCLSLLIMSGGHRQDLASEIADIMPGMAAVNMIYAMVVVQLLLGDLYNSRMCNALHALPLRRESWLTIHTVSGILFSLLPNLVVAVLAMLLIQDGKTVALWWLLETQLQYLYFFGLAVLCALLVGSRFAQAVVYGIFNAAAPLIHLVGVILYQPLLYGVEFSGSWVSRFCPVMQMAGESDYLVAETSYALESETAAAVVKIQMASGWEYLAICAAAGVLLLLAATLLYRRRNLECAGDFMAVKALEPVFLIVYTLSVGIVLQSFGQLFMGIARSGYTFLAVGIVVGFFTGWMLLKRRVNVFGKKQIAGVVLLLVVLFGSFYVTRLDPVGIARWVPAAEEVQSVTLSNGGVESWYNHVEITDPDGIGEILALHQNRIDDKRSGDSSKPNSGDVRRFGLHYTLSNGKRVERFYYISTADPQWAKLEHYHSSPEYILKMPAENAKAGVRSVTFYNEECGYVNIPDDRLQQLLEAVILDCEQNTMSQEAYRYLDKDVIGTLDISMISPDGKYVYTTVECFSDSSNILNWLKDNLPEIAEEKPSTQSVP